MNSVYNKVHTYFMQNANLPKEDKWTEANYLELRLFDSIKYVKMVTDLEDYFSINFSNEDMTNPKFHSMIGLVDIIESKCSAK